MSLSHWSDIGSVLALIVIWLAFPAGASGQVAATQIQISDADALQQLALTAPAGMQTLQANMTPAILVVGADGIGRAKLSVNATQNSSASSTDADTPAAVASAAAAPAQRIQVGNADAIGRFDLRSIGAADVGDPQPNAVGAPASVAAPAPLAPAVRIQVTSADAIGNLALRPIGAPQLPTATAQTASAGDEPSPVATDAAQANDHAVVIADGKLNVRSGPSRQFDVVGQLDTGDGVTVLKQSDDAEWLLIMADNGLTGWISALFVEYQ